VKGCEHSEGRDVLVLVVGRRRHDAMMERGCEGGENTRGKKLYSQEIKKIKTRKDDVR
jgi:hypothetical protein